MKKDMTTQQLLINHYKVYPRLQIQDILKFLHQSCFGCEHLVCSFDSAKEYILQECESAGHQADKPIEALDGNYSRVPLSYLNKGICANTFAKLFVASSKKEKAQLSELIEKIQIAKELIVNGELAFSVSDFDKAVSEWESKGYPAIHHSDTFKTEYNPSYRVISNEYIPFLPLFAEVDKQLSKGQTIVAIEGGSAGGKSTLGKLFEEIYECTIFHMDDFFLQPSQRTPERFEEIGGNIDWERFLSEVLKPLCKGESVNFRKFDCCSMSLREPQKVIAKKLVVVEGAYSMHPELAEYYNISAFLDISPELQRERILHRNSQPIAQRYFDEWIPLEREYFEKTNAKNRCDMVISVV